MVKMRITTYQLRQITVNPERYIARARAIPTQSRQYGNPQRAWMEAAWREYFAAGRNEKALWRAFDEKVQSSKLTKQKAALARGALPMLDQFLSFDGVELQAPHLWHLPSAELNWGAHTLALKRDVVYLTSSGYLVRLYWTDRDLQVSHPDASLMAAGTFAYSEFDLGKGRVERIDVWQLRSGQRRSWDRHQLVDPMIQLRDRLDAVALAIEK